MKKNDLETKRRNYVYPYKKEGERLRDLLEYGKSLGRNRDDLAQAIDYSSRKCFDRYIRGEYLLPKEKAEKLALELGVRVEYLLYEDDLRDTTQSLISSLMDSEEIEIREFIQKKRRIKKVLEIYPSCTDLKRSKTYWDGLVDILDSSIADTISEYIHMYRKFESLESADRYMMDFSEYIELTSVCDDESFIHNAINNSSEVITDILTNQNASRDISERTSDLGDS